MTHRMGKWSKNLSRTCHAMHTAGHRPIRGQNRFPSANQRLLFWMAHLQHMHCVTLMSSNSNVLEDVLDSDSWICVAKTKDANNDAQGCDPSWRLSCSRSSSKYCPLIGQTYRKLSSDWLNFWGINSEDGVENATNAPLDLKKAK